MPQDVIIAPYIQKQRGKMIAATTLGQGVQQGMFMLAQGIDEYRKMLQQQHEDKIKVMTVMGTKYGFNKLGPDFMLDYEKQTGFKFPRDDSGHPYLPPTSEEAMQAKMMPYVDEALKSPRGREIALGYMGLAKQPLSEDEIMLKDRELNIKEKYNNARLGLEALRTNAAWYRATHAGGGKGDPNAPTQLMIDPDSPDPRHPFVVPYVEGGNNKPLTKDQLKALSSASNINATATRLDQSEIKSKTVANNQKVRNLQSFIKLYSDPKTPRTMKGQLADVIVRQSRELDLPITEDKLKDKGFFSFLTDWTNNGMATMDAKVQAADQALQAQGFGSAAKGPLAGMSDDQVKALFQQRLTDPVKPMTPSDIIDQSGDPFRAMEILKDMGAGDASNTP